MRYVRRATPAASGRRYTLSSETQDRVGDVIRAGGWKLDNFRANPIALFNHNRNDIVGKWADVRVESRALSGTFEPAAPGTSEIADTVRALVDQGIIRATSVGFRPIEWKERADGYEFTSQELLEVSLVSVPANPDALSLAKSLGASDSVMRTIFAEPGDPRISKLSPAESGNGHKRNLFARRGIPMTLSEKIQDAQEKIVALRDTLTGIIGKDEPTEEDELQIDDLTSQIAKAEETLGRLQSAEQALAAKVEFRRSATEERHADAQQQSVRVGAPQPKAPGFIKQRSISRDKGDLFFKHLTAHVRSHVERKPIEHIIEREYRGAEDLMIMCKSTVTPATTGGSNWADDFVDAANREFLDVVQTVSLAAQVPVQRAQFDRGAAIKYPFRTPGSLAGGFVGEGSPIPLAADTTGSVDLVPYKLAIITTFTQEMMDYSVPAFEPILRQGVIDDTATALDTLFFDNTAASAGVRPAGLQTYATGSDTAASAGATAANILTDIKGRVGRLVGTNKMGRRMFWVMDTLRALGAASVQNASGAFQFREEMAAGTFGGSGGMVGAGQLFVSPNAPDAVVFLIDGAYVAMAWYPTPMISVSNSATLHMETSPAALSATGTPNTVAAPIRSLYQTDSIGIRLTWPVSWGARAGSVQALTSCAW